jgi:alkylation response protein AidB-like acyl-CoA dehydrogenase
MHAPPARWEDGNVTTTALSPKEMVAQTAPVVREHAPQGEIDRRLAPEVVGAMVDAGIFRAWVPRAFGGLEMDPVSALKVFEGIAHADGSAGWVAGNSAHATLMGQLLPDDGAAEVFADPRVILAGASFPPGAAVPVEGGYRLTGRWPFGSGCHYATWLGVGVLVMDGDTPRTGPDGNPVLILAVVDASEVEIVENWNTLGMRGTGSHDLRLTDVFVPERRTAHVDLDHPGTAYQGPLYRMGLWLDGVRIAITGLGVARAALEAFTDFAQSKTPTGGQSVLADHAVVRDQVARARAMIEAGRATVYQSVTDGWEYVQGGARVTAAEGVSIGLAASFGVDLAVQAVDTLQGLAGTSGFREEQPFQRYFRDLHTLNQHAFASAARYASLGALILGRPSDWPFYNL